MSIFAYRGGEIRNAADTGASDHTGSLGNIDLVALADGGFAMSWDFFGEFWVERTFSSGSAFSKRTEWTSDGYTVFQSFSAAGVAGPSIHLNREDLSEHGNEGTHDDAVTYQWNASLAALSNGGYAITLDDPGAVDAVDGRVGGIKVEFGAIDPAVTALRYEGQAPDQGNYLTADTIDTDVTILSATDTTRSQPEIVELSNGNVLLLWSEATGFNTPDFTIAGMAQLYTPAPGGAEGYAEAGAAFQVAAGMQSQAEALKVAALPNGRFVVTFVTEAGDLKARIFQNGGAPLTGEFLVLPADPAFQTDPDITALANGNFVVSWSTASEPIAGQVFNAAGQKVGAAFTAGDGGTAGAGSSLTALPGGGFIVAWEGAAGGAAVAGSAGIFVQAFDAVGKPVNAADDPVPFAGELASGPEVATLENGDVVLSWVEPTGPGGRGEIYTQIIDIKGAVVGTADADRYTAPNDRGFGGAVYSGGGGNDTILGSAGADRLNGDDGNDIIDGRGGRDGITGGAGNDTLRGSDGNDTIDGDGDNDALSGGAGDDLMRGGAGDDVLDGGVGSNGGNAVADTFIGGGGTDFASYASALDGVVLDFAQDDFSGEAERDSYQEIEGFHGSNFGDTLVGDSRADVFHGLNGSDELTGNGGHDILVGGGGGDTLTGGTGNDLLEGGEGADTLIGGGSPFSDGAGGGNDTATYANAGASVFACLDPNREFALNLYSEDFFYFVENLTGSRFSDRLIGDAAVNQLLGGLGNDTLEGGGGADHLEGGDGSDTYLVDNIRDRVIEGLTGDTDTVLASVSYTLAAGQQIEALKTASASMTTSLKLTGNALANTIMGNAGANALKGMDGYDTLDGGAGADVLTGGLGLDLLKGGAGADRFDFDAVADSTRANRDVVTFARANGDRIDLSTIDANLTAAPGNQAFAWVSTANLGAAFTGAEGQLRLSGGILMADVNGDRRADLEIQIIGTLQAGDVIL